jgi:hypothetical protein
VGPSVIKFLKLFFLICFFFASKTTFGQQKIDIVANNKTVLEVIQSLKKEYKLTFFYSNNLSDLSKTVSINLHQVSIETGLKELFKNTNLAFKFVSGQILIKPKDEIDIKDDTWIVPTPKVKLIKPSIKPFEGLTISGYVLEAESKEGLINAPIIWIEQYKKFQTNSFGFFSFQIEKGEQTLVFRYSSLISDTIHLNITKDTSLQVLLKMEAMTIPTIVINSSDQLSLKNDINSKQKLELDKPIARGSIIGDDVLDNVKFQPGVNSKNEGSTGYIIRGGGLDQNLILLDGAPIMNESHFLGLVSIFHTDAIKNVTLYKSGIPAKYGSRLSSILDIHMKEGNMNQWSTDLTLNPYISGITLQTPLKKDTCSMLISGRTSLLNLWLKNPIQNYLNIEKFSFFDLNAKINYKLNSKNRIFLSSYFGKDNFKTNSKLLYTNENWGNLTGSFRWSSIISEKLFSNFHMIYSNYNYHNEEVFDQVNYYMNSKINSLSLKNDYSFYYSNTHKFSFGIQTQFSKYLPGEEAFFENFIDSTTNVSYSHESNLQLKFNNTLESAIYLQDDIKISERISAMAGVRISFFNHIGKGINNVFDNEQLIDSIPMQGIYNFNTGIEPRLKLSYKLFPNIHLHSTYDRTYQYLMLASNSISRSPTDVWVPVTNNILPQNMHQFTLGGNSIFSKLRTSISSTFFYKKTNNVVDYIDNAFLVLNKQIESQIKQGKSNAIGVETGVIKNQGKTTFTLNYQLSRVKYTIAEINEGKPYFAPHDKRHSFNSNISYKFNNQIEFQANFVVSSGIRTTMPDGIYDVLGIPFVHYGERNKDKLPTYHRMDISINYQGKQHKHCRSELLFSIYNVYNRKNPYSITFEKYSNKAYYNYLLPILPSITYKLHLK